MKRTTSAPLGALTRRVLGLGIAASLSLFSIAAVAKDGFQPQIIVKFRDNALLSKQAELAIVDRLRAVGLRRGVLLQRLRTMATGAEVIRIDRDLGDRDLADLLADLASDPRVEYAEEDRIMKPMLVPNDSRYSEQWHLFESAAGIRAPEAWAAPPPIIGVSIGPGETAFTRILWGASCKAAERVRLRTPAFERP